MYGGPFAPPPWGSANCFILSQIPLRMTPFFSPANFGKLWAPGPKFQNGRQAPDMVTLTFFLCEINPKFFFLA